MTELEALCHSIVNEDVELRRWVGLDIKHEGNVPTPHKEDGKTLEEKEVVEPLDESLDALLHHLVNIGSVRCFQSPPMFVLFMFLQLFSLYNL